MADFRHKWKITITIDAATTRKVDAAQLVGLLKESWNLTPGVDTLTKWDAPNNEETLSTGIRYRSFRVDANRNG
jgi:hypothetical protein